MLNLYLVRHAETQWNEEAKYIGSTDLNLSEKGQYHAKLLARWFKERNLDFLISSAMKRARQTAKLLAQDHQLKMEVDERLNEVDFGLWEGLTHSQIQNLHPEILNKWIEDPSRQPIPQGESWPAFCKRVSSFFKQIFDRYASPSSNSVTGVIVTHGGVIKVAIGNLLSIPAARYWQICQDKGAINLICYEDGRIRLALLNDTCYKK
jgi:alpha-ribazole phosphatase